MIIGGEIGSQHAQTDEQEDGADAAGRETSMSTTKIVVAALSPAAFIIKSYPDFIISVGKKWEFIN